MLYKIDTPLIADLKKQIVEHEIYRSIKDIHHVRIFMEHHVYAVWDFMFLLKAIQKDLTCVEPNWKPSGNPKLRQFINEIVLGEESDEYFDGKSHLEVYWEAMIQAQCNMNPVMSMLPPLTYDAKMHKVDSNIPKTGFDHFKFHEHLAVSGKIHCTAAAFAIGRELFIPEMFQSVLDGMDKELFPQIETLCDYLKRHIELDGDEHGPMSDKLLSHYLSSFDKVCDATPIVVRSLELRLALWDAALAKIKEFSVE